MNYKQKTKRLGLPVVGYDDPIWPELELKKYQIIESMLLAGLKGAVNAVFDEGDMTVKKGDDGKFSVVLSATGAHPSATGSSGGAYFEAPSSVVWDGLDDGYSYFLYLKGSRRTFEEPSDVRPVSSTRRMPDSTSVLMARVDLKGGVSFLDRYPEGKVNARDLAAHVTDSENPHGEAVVQDGIMVRKKIVIDPDAMLEIGSVSVPASVLAKLLSGK